MILCIFPAFGSQVSGNISILNDFSRNFHTFSCIMLIITFIASSSGCDQCHIIIFGF